MGMLLKCGVSRRSSSTVVRAPWSWRAELFKLKMPPVICAFYSVNKHVQQHNIWLVCMSSAGDIWICKPTALNQGRGIFLIRNLEEFRSTYLEQEFPDIGRRPRLPADKIVQRLGSLLLTCFKECNN